MKLKLLQILGDETDLESRKRAVKLLYAEKAVTVEQRQKIQTSAILSTQAQIKSKGDE